MNKQVVMASNFSTSSSKKFSRKFSISRKTHFTEIHKLLGLGANIQQFDEQHDAATLNELLLIARKKWRKS
jgi:hypothetical protein